MRTLLYILASLMLFITACSGKDQHDSKHNQVNPLSLKGLPVETVRSSALPDSFEVSGTVRSRTSAMVSARIPGTVSILRVREGERVHKGQLLMQLEAQETLANATGAAAGIEEAQRSLDEALARRKLADTTFERFQKLYNEQVVSRQEFDIRQTERDLATQGAARAEARLKQAREAARAYSALADHTRIIAPLSGVVSSRKVDLGATVFPAQPLLTIEDERDYQLELVIPESLSARVREGTPLQISIDALGNSFDSSITEVVPSTDTISRTFIAKARLARAGLKSGMFGRAAIRLGTASKGILIPKKALVEQGALTSVWTVSGDNIVRMRLVKAGKVSGDKIEIISGLSDGERIVVGGTEKVSEGARVE